MIGWRGLLALLPSRVQGRLPSRGESDPPRAHGVRAQEPQDHGPLLPYSRGGPPGARGAPRRRSRAGRGRPRGVRDGGIALQRLPRGRVRADFRRLLHRVQRSHPARPRRRSRLCAGGSALRRAQRGGAAGLRADHRRRPAGGKKVGICGQAPSDFPDFAEFLVEQGIDSISLTPDSLLRTSERVAAAEARPRRLRPARRAADLSGAAANGDLLAEPVAAYADTEPMLPNKKE